MKRLYLYEELSAMKLEPDSALAPLLNEGVSILKALIFDFTKLNQFQLFIFASKEVGESLVAEKLINLNQWIVPEISDPFLNVVNPNDAVLIMAPESDGILAHRVKQLNETGAENLNCSVEAITLAGDKYQTFLYLNRMDIPTPATMLLGDFLKAGQLTFPLVLKPRYGAGTSDTFYINDIGFLKNKASSILDLDQWIVQELKQGLPASYCFFVHKGQCTPIISSFQNMECLDLQFGYQGGSLPLPLDFEYRALILAQKTLLDFGGLNGWVGVDLILGQDTKGIKDFVFEINPRLTTSYLGARHHLLINPASLWAGNDLLLSQPESKGNNIVYYKNGTIEIKRGRTQ
jgi:hypothetical protein